jgi:pyruvate,water dikinase
MRSEASTGKLPSGDGRSASLTIPFNKLGISDVEKVGGKNASLGEMISALSSEGISVPDGFATTAEAYWLFLDQNSIREELTTVLGSLKDDMSNLQKVSSECRTLIRNAVLPTNLTDQIGGSYLKLDQKGRSDVAVRSSATAEDLPGASFAGLHESFLNVCGIDDVLDACKECFSSLFTERAIKYRHDKGFDHMKIALSVGVQKMVRSDLSCSGIAFTIDPDTGFRDTVVINGTWGLGENIVQGRVDPDEFILFKPSLRKGLRSMISSVLGKKQETLIYTDSVDKATGTKNIETPICKQKKFVLNEEELTLLANWCLKIEEHYDMPMDIEWAKDGRTDRLYIIQARPETVHATDDDLHLIRYHLIKNEGELLCEGIGLGNGIASGRARLLNDPSDASKLLEGEVLVTDITNPDWDPVMKKASAIVTNKGGRTSHAAIIAREMGVVAVVGAEDATTKIKDGQLITVSCAGGQSGKIYDGELEYSEHVIDTRKISLPETQVMLILADPDQAFRSSFLPSAGVGLMRMEFVISNHINVHPMVLAEYDELKDEVVKQKIDQITVGYPVKSEYFVDKLSQAVATVAAAFYPREVIVRMSDFKTNEYAKLTGGAAFEPEEENPMLGFRGASRYHHPLYKKGFRLECLAMKRVRDDMGLTNVKLMIPFCRTPAEGRRVIETMNEFGLVQGKNDLEIYTMIEVPSNVILADEFAKIFDGFSIGSNDLTQLTLGLDRDSSNVQDLFNENDAAVRKMITEVIRVAKQHKIKIGLCGQAPSDLPDFAGFLVNEGVDSISFNRDALLKGIENIKKAEQNKK